MDKEQEITLLVNALDQFKVIKVVNTLAYRIGLSLSMEEMRCLLGTPGVTVIIKDRRETV